MLLKIKNPSLNGGNMIYGLKYENVDNKIKKREKIEKNKS